MPDFSNNNNYNKKPLEFITEEKYKKYINFIVKTTGIC